MTDDAGTGVVHQAPAFGEDDYRVCLARKVIKKGQDLPCPVDSNGLFTDPVAEVKGLHVKKGDDTLIKLIKDKGRLIQKDNLDHSYPFCWRSNTPLIYKAVPSWFIKVEEIRDKVVENNKKTYWSRIRLRRVDSTAGWWMHAIGPSVVIDSGERPSPSGVPRAWTRSFALEAWKSCLS